MDSGAEDFRPPPMPVEPNAHYNDQPVVWMPALCTGPLLEIENVFVQDATCLGPMVAIFENCRFEGCKVAVKDMEMALWPTEKDAVTGAVNVRNCLFRRVVFVGIGFCGTAEYMEWVRNQVAISQEWSDD